MRAINVNADQATVVKACAKHKADISHIEGLPCGGTRVVLRTGDDAATLRIAFGKKVIMGSVSRDNLSFRR